MIGLKQHEKRLRQSTGMALAFCVAALAASPGALAKDRKADNVGVLVMAHGGNDEWNREVAATLAPLDKDYPMAIAFGMADAVSLQEGVKTLEAEGAARIAVIRLFISAESWRERTEQILGIAPGAPEKPKADDQSAHHGGHGGGDHSAHGASAAQGGGHAAHGGNSMEFWRIDTDASFALSEEGLADAPEMGDVLGGRALGLSKDPARESVLILAHGPEDDEENARWIAKINERAEAIRKAAPFRAVQVETLREDWPDKRKAAEERVRAFVETAGENDGVAIVIPYRVQGFGPYAKVLEGLPYTSDGKGLAPSPEIERWARRQVEKLAEGEFREPGEIDAAAN
jgi:hypothetical protein